MKKYVIITDSCSDLEKKFRDEFDIKYAPNTYSYDGKTEIASLDWEGLSFKEFYDIMRNGTRIITSQVNADEYRKIFKKAIDDGCDILNVCVSSGLSSSYHVCCRVRDELLEKYPDSKIICVDTRMSSLGLSLLCIRAAELRNEGYSIEETAKWIEEHKFTVRQEGTVDKLIYLKQAGRVSAASAFFGGLLNIKPIIISDIHGKNIAIEKVKGRKASFERIAERIKEAIIDVPYQRILIGHADCLDDANQLKEIILSKLPNKDVEVRISKICQMIGASCGPGMMGVYYYGIEETYDSEAKK